MCLFVSALLKVCVSDVVCLFKCNSAKCCYWFLYCSISLFMIVSSMFACLKYFIVSVSAWYLFSQTTRFMPAFIIIIAQVLQGVILQYRVEPSRGIPKRAACMIAFCSACRVRTQCWVVVPSVFKTLRISWSSSSQCGSPAGAPT